MVATFIFLPLSSLPRVRSDSRAGLRKEGRKKGESKSSSLSPFPSPRLARSGSNYSVTGYCGPWPWGSNQMFLGISAAVNIVERNSFSLSARPASYFLWPYLSSLRAPLSLPLPILFKSSLFLPAQRPHISFGTSHAAASQWEKRTERERGRGRRGRKRRSYHLQLRSL